MPTLNMHDAKTQFSKLIARVEAGEEIVIARDGTPVARLVAVRQPAAKRVAGRGNAGTATSGSFRPDTDRSSQTRGLTVADDRRPGARLWKSDCGRSAIDWHGRPIAPGAVFVYSAALCVISEQSLSFPCS